MASPYFLVSHANLLRVPKVNLPTILSIRDWKVYKKDLRANSPQTYKETKVVALPKRRKYSSL